MYISAYAEETGMGTDTIRFTDLALVDLIVKIWDDDPDNYWYGSLLFDWAGEGGLMVEAAAQIERFVFADGTSLSRLDFYNNDRLQLFGTSGDDLIIGGAKDDLIWGGDGNDTLDAGAGNGYWQHLRGQSGNDTYLVGSETGNVWMMHDAETGGSDTVRFKDLSLNDLVLDTFAEGSNGDVLRFS